MMGRLYSPQSVQSLNDVLPPTAKDMRSLDLGTSTSSVVVPTIPSPVPAVTPVVAPIVSFNIPTIAVLSTFDVPWVDGLICTVYKISSTTSNSYNQDATNLLNTLSEFGQSAAGWGTAALEFRNVLYSANAAVAVVRDSYDDVVACGALVLSSRSARASLAPQSHAWLSDVIVTPAYRGLGLARFVVRALLRRAHRRLLPTNTSPASMSVSVSVALVATPGTEGLYESLGFHISPRYSASIMAISLPPLTQTLTSSSSPSSCVGDPSEMIAHSGFAYGLTVAFSSECSDPAHIRAAEYCASVVSPTRLGRFSEERRTGKRTGMWTCATATDPCTGAVTAAAWASFYGEEEGAQKSAFVGPVVADDIRLAAAIVSRLTRKLRYQIDPNKQLDIGMVALNVAPARSAALVWSMSSMRFREIASLKYMVRTDDIETTADSEEEDEGELDDECDEEEQVEVEHELRHGELEFVDSRRYFCLAGYKG